MKLSNPFRPTLGKRISRQLSKPHPILANAADTVIVGTAALSIGAFAVNFVQALFATRPDNAAPRFSEREAA